MKATIEETNHLTRDELTAVKTMRSAIENQCRNFDDVKGWLLCLTGWFIYSGGNHIALHKKSGDTRRVMIVTA